MTPLVTDAKSSPVTNGEDQWHFQTQNGNGVTSLGSNRAYHRMHYELDTAAQGRMRFLDIMMPNGKKLGDCTGAEVREIAEELERFSKEIKAAFKLA